MVGGQAYAMDMWQGKGHMVGCGGMWQGVRACAVGRGMWQGMVVCGSVLAHVAGVGACHKG